MLLQKLLHAGAKFIMGKDLATAIMLLKLILDAINNRKVTDVARFVYQKLPADWRTPQGPASETEFVEMVQAGQNFLGKVKSVLS